MDFSTRKNVVFITLAGFFVTNAIVAELIGGKVVEFFGLFKQSVGILLWPVVFVLTDLINEHYGRKGVRRLSFITAGLIAYTFFLLSAAMAVPAVGNSPVSDGAFYSVFGQSRWIIIGSIVAFIISQLVDVQIFWIFRKLTGGRHIWLRATGSTAVSQLVDTFTVQFIAFVVPGKWTLGEFAENALWGYVFKLGIAVLMTPLIYAGHYLIKQFIAKDEPTPAL